MTWASDRPCHRGSRYRQPDEVDVTFTKACVQAIQDSERCLLFKHVTMVNNMNNQVDIITETKTHGTLLKKTGPGDSSKTIVVTTDTAQNQK